MLLDDKRLVIGSARGITHMATALLLLAAGTTAASAAPVAANQLNVQQIQADANQLAQARQLLSHADANVRSSALNKLLQSENTALREMAYAVGFGSADDVARAITLSHRFNEVQTLQITLNEGDGGKAEQLRRSLGGVMNVTVRSYNEVNGRFEVRNFGGSHNGYGEVAGLQVSLSQNACSAKFELNDVSELSGSVTCAGVTLPATIDLF